MKKEIHINLELPSNTKKIKVFNDINTPIDTLHIEVKNYDNNESAILESNLK